MGKREIADDDRRRITLTLTPAGAQVHEQARERAKPMQRRFAVAVDTTNVAAACGALAAYLEESELATVVKRRDGDV